MVEALYRLLVSFYPLASEQFSQSSTRHLECHVAGEEESHDVIADDAVPGEGSVLLAGVVRVVDGGVVDHEGDHEVDVDPQRVVEHEPSAANRLIGKFVTITEKAPTRAFSWLKAPTSAFTFKTLC